MYNKKHDSFDVEARKVVRNGWELHRANLLLVHVLIPEKELRSGNLVASALQRLAC